MIPFDIEKLEAGWKPVTRDGREVKHFRWNKRYCRWQGFLPGKLISSMWGEDGRFSKFCESDNDLFLLAPDEDIVVEVVSTSWKSNGIRWTGDVVDRLKPGRYKLVKID